MESKAFSLGQILSITHGRMLVKNFDDVYQILDFMVGENMMTHQLPRARREAMPYLMEAFSEWIEQAHAEVDAFFAEWDKVNTNVPSLKQQHINQVWTWMETMETKYGATHEVYPIHFEDTQSPSPYGDINWKVDGDDE